MQHNTRVIAARALDSIIGRGRSLDATLTDALTRLTDKRDRAFVQELVYGVLRWYWRLMPQLQHLLRKPLRDRDRDVEMLLLLGLYQLQHLSTANHAAVSETVAACGALRKSWARGLVNATLRNALRQADELARVGKETAVGSSAHPVWLIDMIESDWPADALSLFEANNSRPPMTLRVNARHGTRDAYLNRLLDAGIMATPTAHSPSGLRLTEAVPVDSLPGFDAGDVSVQDEAAQLAASVLHTQTANRVLDACAAPGGKTAHILEQHAGTLVLVALDNVPARVATLEATLARLGLAAHITCADAAASDEWWDGDPFDRILIDAPCSGSGVIRRHPDIKHLRRPGDIGQLAAQQARLLDSLWPLLGPGGKLVYATCSVLRAENDGIVGPFLERTPGAVIEPVAAEWGATTRYGRQILTGSDDMDGFYYARITRSGLNSIPGPRR